MTNERCRSVFSGSGLRCELTVAHAGAHRADVRWEEAPDPNQIVDDLSVDALRLRARGLERDIQLLSDDLRSRIATTDAAALKLEDRIRAVEKALEPPWRRSP